MYIQQPRFNFNYIISGNKTTSTYYPLNWGVIREIFRFKSYNKSFLFSWTISRVCICICWNYVLITLTYNCYLFSSQIMKFYIFSYFLNQSSLVEIRIPLMHSWIIFQSLTEIVNITLNLWVWIHWKESTIWNFCL